MFEKLMVKIYGPDWKTSLNGDLNLIKSCAVALSGVLVITPSSPHWMIYLSLACVLISGGSQSALGRVMVDAGSVLAKVPGKKEPQIVPSTEVPLDSKAKVIVQPQEKQ